MLDVFLLSYDEDFADEHFEILKMFVPMARRVHGIEGIFQAHQECARQSKTSHFYVVDADAVIEEGFDFKFVPSPDIEAYWHVPETDCIHIWMARNPINGMTYGYGGIKMFPKDAVLNATCTNVDMTTSLQLPIVIQEQVSNITAFNTDPFNTWKSAFRECVKLASRQMVGSYEKVDDKRLDTWCTVGADKHLGKWCLLGAQQGKEYGLSYKHDQEAISKINDFDWLRQRFEGIKK